MLNIKLTSQLNRNIASGAIVHGLNIIAALISYPIFIHFLGFELFSVWTLLSVIISFAQVGDFGISKAVIFYTAKARTNKNIDGIRELLSSALIFLAILSFIIQCVLWLFNIQIIHILSIPPAYIEQSIIVIPLIGLSVFTYLIYDSLSGILTGFGRLDLSNSLLLFLNMVKILCTVFFLSLSNSLISMSLGVLVSNIIFILIIFYIISTKKFISKFPITKASLASCNRILKYGFPVLGVQVFNMLMFPVIKILMANFLSVNSVGFFELASKAAYSLRTFFEKGLFALMPEFSRFHKNEDESGIKTINLRVNSITKKLFYFGTPTFIVFSLFSPLFLKLWLGKSYNSDILIGFLLLQPGIIAGLLALPSYFALLATNNQQKCFYEAILRTVLSVGIILICSWFFNLHSFIIYAAISFSVILSNLYLFYTFRAQVNYVSKL